jgi:hypothetical protein
MPWDSTQFPVGWALGACRLHTTPAHGSRAGPDRSQAKAKSVMQRMPTQRACGPGGPSLGRRLSPGLFRVLGICRCVAGGPHDAQVATHATFLVLVLVLVLARRAGAIHRRESVGPRLFGLARRISARARVDAGRRRLHERRRTGGTPGPGLSTDAIADANLCGNSARNSTSSPALSARPSPSAIPWGLLTMSLPSSAMSGQDVAEPARPGTMAWHRGQLRRGHDGWPARRAIP